MLDDDEDKGLCAIIVGDEYRIEDIFQSDTT